MRPSIQETAGADRMQTVVLGLCEDYPEESRSLEEARRDLLVVKTNGFTVLRVALGWDAIEPQKGVYDWSFWDEYIAMADELGVRLIPYVCYTPQWAARNPEGQFWTQPPRDMQDFAEFLGTVASRYRNSVDSWEIWNEPDNKAYWTGSAGDFSRLLIAGSEAIRAADPGALVVSGGLAWDLQFLKEVMKHPGVGPAVDVVNLHNYFETWAQEGVEQVDDYVFRADETLDLFQIPAELWMAEIGYSNFRTNNVVSEVYRATYDYEHTAQYQAETVFRSLVPLLFPRKVSLIAWYRINDLPTEQEVIGDVNNRYLGVLDQHGQPKPALNALRFFQQLFGNGYQPANDAVQVKTDLQSDLESYAFRLADGRLAVIAWLKIISPITPVGGTRPLRDGRTESVQFDLPEKFPSGGAFFDSAGNRLESIPAGSQTVGTRITGGSVTILVLEPKGD